MLRWQAPKLFENERDDVVKFVKNQVLSADQIAYNRTSNNEKKLEENLSVTTLAKVDRDPHNDHSVLGSTF